MTQAPRPSRLFTIGGAIVALVVPRDRREMVEGDLIELWHERRQIGRRDLRRAYVRDLAGLVAATRRQRRRDARSIAQRLRGGFAMWMDVRHAIRVFRRQPVFTAAAVLTLTLGIAASTAIFTAVDRLLLRPLPYPTPEQLMEVRKAPIRFGPGPALSQAFRALEIFDGAGVYDSGGTNLEGRGESARLVAAIADDGFFEAMGVGPLLGRPMPSHTADGFPHFAVLAYDTWVARFQGDRAIVGTAITLNGKSYTVSGVMPPGFRFPGRTEVWLPPGADFQVTGTAYAPTVVARLAAGVTIERARAAL
ncbi:MAG TPA: ABC transporter permease, partial [Vicinamibacterales bacterium]|nr:ABC transporter permease [Vicinamibacterales bacterium]